MAKKSSIRLVAYTSYEGGPEAETQINLYHNLDYATMVTVQGVLGQKVLEANNLLGAMGIIAKSGMPKE